MSGQHIPETAMSAQDLEQLLNMDNTTGQSTRPAAFATEQTNPFPLTSMPDVLQQQQQQQQPITVLGPQTPPAQPLADQGAPMTGVYSSSGFDMIGILSRLVNRPNPQINLGPIDMSCSFLVTDARQYDCPIVYCSPNFETLTGYKSSEILGRNCRFLQAPDGQVTGGSRRQYTDNLAVYHLKSYLLQCKEHQASIINYRKGGQPFVNLVTVIPIQDDNNQTAFFVGLQVDLVEQPNAILERMKDGTYIVNYQQMNIPPYIPGSNVMEPVDDYFREIPTVPTSNSLARPEIMQLVSCSGENEQQVQQEWNRLLLDQSLDFIHVLSLKGFFLYCSRSCSTLLEHDPEELVGHSLSSICHPSHIVPVMREIKEVASDSEKVVSLLYRVRRKYSGYMWMECQGKLHVDQAKGRKCLIFAGRERPVYRLPLKEVVNANVSAGGVAKTEFWAKMSLEGLYIRVTPSSQDVVGYAPGSLEGSSVYRYAGDEFIPDVTRALGLVRMGEIGNLTHTMRNSKGQYVEVVSSFYPGDVAFSIGKPSFALVQTRLKSSLPTTDERSSYHLEASRIGDENLFAELETVRGTNWQYELHQLQQANQRLHEQIRQFMESSDKKSKKKKKKTASPATGDNQTLRICAQCQCTDSPEWRKGPNGPKELCNACGLRYAKSLAAKKGDDAEAATA